MPSNEAPEQSEAHAQGWGGDAPAGTDWPDLPYVRLTQRRKPLRDRRRLWVLLALVLLGHVVLGWFAFLILRPAPQPERGTGVFTVTLIEPSSALPAPPPLLPPPPLPGQPVPPGSVRRVPYEPPATGAIRATLEGTPEPQLQLYDAQGQVRLPPQAAAAAATPAYRTPELKGSRISSGKSPLPYKPTPFNKVWAPPDETLGDQTIGRAFDKAVEKTTVTRTVHLPGGIKVKCGVSPLLLAFGCLPEPPPPPPDNGNDIRRSLPPPETLTGRKVTLPTSAASVPAPASSR